MRETEPKVWLIMKPQIDWDNVSDYLSEIGGSEWYERVVTDDGPINSSGDMIAEFAGRLCYRAWTPGLNPNVTKVRKDSQAYLTNILVQRHGSVLEHANYTFIFQDVSRVFTHELVRHRAGVAISQESLRYVRLAELGFRIPDALNPLRAEVVTMVEMLEDFQKNAATKLKLDDEGTPFQVKKFVTSALRRLAPLGLSTTIVWTANVRTLRHVISMRTAKDAEEEIRTVFQDVASIMKDECPLLFADYTMNNDGEFVTPHWKV